MAASAWKNRSRIEIIGEILAATVGGLKKTYIMYRVKMNHRQLSEYLTFLKGAALISATYDKDERAMIYRTAKKGLDYLAHLESLDRLSRIDEPVEAILRREEPPLLVTYPESK